MPFGMENEDMLSYSAYVNGHENVDLGINRPPMKCGICQEPFNIEELSHDAFTPTCKEHRAFSNYFQAWKVQQGLGLPFEYPAPKCQVCGEHLSQEQLDNVDGMDMLIVCDNHIHHRHSFNPSEIRLRENITYKH